MFTKFLSNTCLLSAYTSKYSHASQFISRSSRNTHTRALASQRYAYTEIHKNKKLTKDVVGERITNSGSYYMRNHMSRKGIHCVWKDSQKVPAKLINYYFIHNFSIYGKCIETRCWCVYSVSYSWACPSTV